MTFLDVVNQILIRMREPQVDDVNANAYSALIGAFVNDAKQICEDAWDWSALRKTLIINTQAGIFNYILTDSQNRIEVLNTLNFTSRLPIHYKPQVWFDNVYWVQTPDSGSPQYFTFNGIDQNGDTQIDVYPKPDGVYELRFNVIQRTGLLTDNADPVTIPTQPIIQLAFAMALRERGETGGTSAAEQFNVANTALSDAIALDSSKHPEELVWSAGRREDVWII